MCNKHWSSLFSEGLRNIFDNCPLVPNRKQTNKDGDSFGDECDNCPSTTNSDQVNENGFYRVVQFQTSRASPLPSFILLLPLLLPAYVYIFLLLLLIAPTSSPSLLSPPSSPSSYPLLGLLLRLLRLPSSNVRLSYLLFLRSTTYPLVLLLFPPKPLPSPSPALPPFPSSSLTSFPLFIANQSIFHIFLSEWQRWRRLGRCMRLWPRLVSRI